MIKHSLRWGLWAVVAGTICGCATVKQSDTPRTGVEQLLISSAVDRSLDKVDFARIAGANVYLEAKYLDCVDKNYIIVALHHRLLQIGCKIAEKPDESDVICEVASGSVGTDRSDLFVGVPDLPVPSVALTIPRMPLFTRNKSVGTAKLQIVAYDAKSKAPMINTEYTLARSDQRNWSVLGVGSATTGTLPNELARHTGENESLVGTVTAWNAKRDTAVK